MCFHFCVYETPMFLESIWTECDTEQKSNERDKNKAAGIIIYKLTSILKDAILHLEVWRALWYTVLNSSETGSFKALVLPEKKVQCLHILCADGGECVLCLQVKKTLYISVGKKISIGYKMLAQVWCHFPFNRPLIRRKDPAGLLPTQQGSVSICHHTSSTWP